jgi:serine/threonine protein kinase
MSTLKEQLQELAELLEQGLITAEDFEQEKQKLLASRHRTASIPPASGPTLATGAAPTTLGSYAILGEIGQGGMGVVYRARHRSETFAARQGGDVAIKVLHPHYAARPDIVERFEREADMGIKLEHPGIVRAFELIIDSGQVALVMELVAGQPMDTLIGNVTGPIPWGRAQPLFQQLLDAVGHAHVHGVVHRDLKPENIIVGPDGALKVLDFGIAKDLSSDKTKTGTGMGTVDYMAPEQYLDASSVDQRADIYALGMTLYEMVAGRLPWDASSTEFGILEMKKKGDLPPPTDFYPDIPPQVVAAIARATAIRIADRFGSTADFADTLSQPVKQSRSAPPSAVGSGTVIEAEAPEVTADEATDPPAATPPVPAPSPPIPSPSSPQPLPTVSERGAGKGFLAFGSLAFGILAVVGAGAFYMLDEVDNSSSRSSKMDRDNADDEVTVRSFCKQMMKRIDEDDWDKEWDDQDECIDDWEVELDRTEDKCGKKAAAKWLEGVTRCVDKNDDGRAGWGCIHDENNELWEECEDRFSEEDEDEDEDRFSEEDEEWVDPFDDTNVGGQ